MRWKNFGEMSTDDGHKVYFSGEEDRHSYGFGFFCAQGRSGCCLRTPNQPRLRFDLEKLRYPDVALREANQRIQKMVQQRTG